LQRLQIAVLALLGSMLSACSMTPVMETYVPARCHGSARPFTTYTLEHRNVPGFILQVVDVSIRSALDRQGLSVVDEADADVLVRTELDVINRNPPPAEGDPFGEPVATSQLNRFVTHLVVNVIDRRTDQLIWTGAMDRAHAIEGGETFHDDRAIAIITQAFDDMFVGLTTPCE